MKITVAGTGYVGLVTGVCLASVGYSVTCLDLDEKKVEALRRGVSPIYEKDLEEMMAQHRERITYTTDKKAAYADADFIFIGVGTPENEDGSANLSAVYAVADDIASYAVNSPIVAVKSTVPIGTCDKLEKYINDKMKPGFEVRVVSNPEFLAQGTAVRDTLKASRIVVGAKDAKAAQAMKGLYEPFELPVILTDRRSSEMIKYASNDFLALKISYINEIANLCELVGANIDDVA
ncbi:MAG TPA: nucleotide sugar dehydrogenase, partial [Clostridiales bacterium]|nr:nucleotide sugar dehydrogenase [Clostridiales bacterium]